MFLEHQVKCLIILQPHFMVHKLHHMMHSFGSCTPMIGNQTFMDDGSRTLHYVDMVCLFFK